MVAGFEMEVRKMEIGTMSEPVKTRFGYHLIWLHERID
jgi:peptidyl-prolyl cis-trans isomerase C